MKNNGIIIWE